MHYKNGKAVKTGDVVSGKDVNDKKIHGIVVNCTSSETDTCNVRVIPIPADDLALCSTIELLLTDDTEHQYREVYGKERQDVRPIPNDLLPASPGGEVTTL